MKTPNIELLIKRYNRLAKSKRAMKDGRFKDAKINLVNRLKQIVDGCIDKYLDNRAKRVQEERGF